MVTLVMMAECRGGNHEKCPGGISAPPGEFGGAICECSCHSKSSSRPSAGTYKQEVEHEFWRAIRDGDDPDDFELYLQQFPDGAYTELARQKLAALRKK